MPRAGLISSGLLHSPWHCKLSSWQIGHDLWFLHARIVSTHNPQLLHYRHRKGVRNFKRALSLSRPSTGGSARFVLTKQQVPRPRKIVHPRYFAENCNTLAVMAVASVRYHHVLYCEDLHIEYISAVSRSDMQSLMHSPWQDIWCTATLKGQTFSHEAAQSRLQGYTKPE